MSYPHVAPTSYSISRLCFTLLVNMFPNVRYGALLSLVLSSCLQAAPQDQGPGPVISPTVDSMTMLGSGCPLGSGGIVREMRNNTPVFLFDEWNLNLADAEAGTTTVSKFCTEEISLGHGPQGYQVRIAAITVAGWADTDINTRLAVSVETKLGGVEAGVSFPLASRLFIQDM